MVAETGWAAFDKRVVGALPGHILAIQAYPRQGYPRARIKDVARQGLLNWLYSIRRLSSTLKL